MYREFVEFFSNIVLLGALQGIILAGIISVKALKNNRTMLLFSAVILIISLHLLEVTSMIKGFTINYPILDGISYPLIFLIGPFIYFYITLSAGKKISFAGRGWLHILHFVPFILLTISLWPYYTFDSELKRQYLQAFYEQIFIPESVLISLKMKLQMVAHALQLTLYLIISYREINRFNEHVVTQNSNNNLISNLNWLKTITAGFAGYTALYLLLVTLLLTLNSFLLIIDTVWLFFISFFSYFLGYKIITLPVTAGTEVAGSGRQKSTISADTIDSDIEKIYNHAVNIMEEEKLFLNNELKLSDLAERSGYSLHKVSEAINMYSGKNFFDFVNEFRIKESKRMIKENPELKILTIAFESGFNNKVSFNRVFKKSTGLTPTEYRKSMVTAQ